MQLLIGECVVYADVWCVGMQRDAGHTMELLKLLPTDVTVDIFKAFTAHIADMAGP